MRARSLIILAAVVAASIAVPVWADLKAQASHEAKLDDMQLAKSGDGFLGFRLEEGSIVLVVLDADKSPVPVKEGSGTMFLTYTEDGHKSKVDLALASGPTGSVFKAAIPKGAHGPTKAVVKVTADGKSHQGSFEFRVPAHGGAEGHEAGH